jgi:hypothetical protein
VEHVVGCTPDERVCQQCGKLNVVIGNKQSEQLDLELARYFPGDKA